MLNGFFDGVLICSGDGDLSAAIARGIRRIQPHTKIFTLSVPGTGSRRLKERTDLFDGNMVVGNDLVRPAHNSARLEPTY